MPIRKIIPNSSPHTFREACDVAADYGERLAAEGEICWGGMHSWKTMVDTLEAVDRPNIGFQADMAHTLLYLLGYNRPEDRLLPVDFKWDDRETLDKAFKKLTNALRPWTIDFHVAQNDGTVHGTGSHDKTGRHCLALIRMENWILHTMQVIGFAMKTVCSQKN